METLAELNIQNLTFLTIKWIVCDDTNRRIWSDDTWFLGCNTLEELKIVLPHRQFHGTTVVTVSERINEIESS